MDLMELEKPCFYSIMGLVNPDYGKINLMALILQTSSAFEG